MVNYVCMELKSSLVSVFLDDHMMLIQNSGGLVCVLEKARVD